MQTAVPQQQQRAVERGSITPPTGYFIVLPGDDLPGFAQCPLAIGVQLAVARLCMCAGGRVPVSRADLAAWCDDCATRDHALGSAIKYAIDRLRACGLLDGQAEPGKKLWLQPGWGLGRDGKARPWNWDRPDRGRPSRLSFRKIPITLLDDYLGTCQTDAHDPAQVERWFDRPLLDLADLGAYALRWAGIQVAARFLVRLRHLGLIDERDQPVPPQSRWTLLLQAASGTLTTIDDNGQVVTVQLSEQGRHAISRKGGVVPEPAPSSLAGGGPDRGSNSGPSVTNDDPASPCAKLPLDEAPFAAWERVDRSEIQSNPRSQPQMIMAEEVVVLLDQKVEIGHRLVNQDRKIPPEEWFALVALQEAIGVPRLLEWQARAAAAGRSQVSPAYYRHCAASEAFGTPRPAAPPAEASSAHAEERQEPITVPTPFAPPTPTRPVLDADQQAALRELEAAAGERVRAPWRLAGTSAACIRAWAECISHPGLVAYCRLPPLHYAVDQLALCLPPPNAAQLARWASLVTPGATGVTGQGAGGERWSSAAIADMTAQWPGLFSLGSDVPAGQLGGPGQVASLPAGPPRAEPAAPAQRPTMAAPAGPRSAPSPESASPPAGASRPEPPAPSPRPAAALSAASSSDSPVEPDADQRRWNCAPSTEGVSGAAFGYGSMTNLVRDLNFLWNQVSNDLQRRLDRAAYRSWIRGARLVALADGVATVQARNAHQRDRLERCEAALIAECLSLGLGRPIRVVITLDGDAPEEVLVSMAPASGTAATRPELEAAPSHPRVPSAGPPATPVSPLSAALSACPAWIAPARWMTVPPLLRPALVGSTLRDGQIVPVAAFWRKALDDPAYAEVLARLIAAAESVRST
jgi:hypothetical protein